MLVDVVRFSDVTTSLGIHVGDRFLLEIANRIQLLFGQTAFVGRISGDVFGIVFPNTNNEQFMRQMFERLVEHFKTPMHYEGTAFIADFNVGVVCSGQCDFDITHFVSRAETALKQAKENKYENYYALTKSDKTDTGRSLALKADLKRALAQNELELYYQPKVDLKTLSVIGAECLLRWNHPLDGVLFPGPLIEAAESYNMMNELGYWTLEQAFRALVQLNTLKMPIVLSVNISPTQLYDNQLVPTLTMLSETYAMPLTLIELELTEDVAPLLFPESHLTSEELVHHCLVTEASLRQLRIVLLGEFPTVLNHLLGEGPESLLGDCGLLDCGGVFDLNTGSDAGLGRRLGHFRGRLDFFGRLRGLLRLFGHCGAPPCSRAA